MKRFLVYIVLFITILSIPAQDVVTMPERTPEQEATSQTERIQRELNLSTEQVQRVYEINLFYARQRQQSNSRSEAMERVKNKNADLKRVLNEDQYQRLQNKHYNRSSYDTSSSAVENMDFIMEPSRTAPNEVSSSTENRYVEPLDSRRITEKSNQINRSSSVNASSSSAVRSLHESSNLRNNHSTNTKPTTTRNLPINSYPSSSNSNSAKQVQSERPQNNYRSSSSSSSVNPRSTNTGNTRSSSGSTQSSGNNTRSNK